MDYRIDRIKKGASGQNGIYPVHPKIAESCSEVFVQYFYKIFVIHSFEFQAGGTEID